MAARNHYVLAKYRAYLFELARRLARLFFTRVTYDDEMRAPGLKPNLMPRTQNRIGEGKAAGEEKRTKCRTHMVKQSLPCRGGRSSFIAAPAMPWGFPLSPVPRAA
jgi:hypothetical protein